MPHPKEQGARRVHLAHTGGTIGMRRTANGYAPSPGYLAQELEGMPELRHADMPEWELHEYDPILDSSNLRPRDWLEIARDIVARADDFDGFVVLHGTDTMAYTASALAFMLRGLGKPVVLTGSQIPLCELRSDGAREPADRDADRGRASRRSPRSACTSARACCAAAAR